MSLTYSTWVTALATQLAGITITNASATNPSTDTNFNNILPRCIEYAELRMYRDPDLDFLSTRMTDASISTTSGARDISVPASIFIVEDVNLITPAGANPGDSGSKRNPLVRQGRSYIDSVWADTTDTGLPTDYAALSDTDFLLGPTPDNTYVAEFTGIFRPDPLSHTNTTTFLTTNLPDMFLAASLIYMFGYQRNWSALGDDPASAQTWETQYAKLKMGAAVESARQKAQSVNWTAYAPTPVTNPPRS